VIRSTKNEQKKERYKFSQKEHRNKKKMNNKKLKKLRKYKRMLKELRNRLIVLKKKKISRSLIRGFIKNI